MNKAFKRKIKEAIQFYPDVAYKEIIALITAREDRLVETLEKYKCGKHKKAIQLIREGDKIQTKDFVSSNKKMDTNSNIQKLPKRRGVKLSSTVGGQRELIREMRNKLDEVIDVVNELKGKNERR